MMLKITIVQVGKTKQTALQELISEFYKRLGSGYKTEEVTVKTEKELWNKVPQSAYTIALEVKGVQLTSEQFSAFIEERKNQGDSHLVFLIGPPEGFTKYEKEPDLKFSLSAMTFSHQTVRLLLAEQIYRSISILEGKPFAK